MEVYYDSDIIILLIDYLIDHCAHKDFTSLGLSCHCTHEKKNELKAAYSLEKNGDILHYDYDIECGIDYLFTAHHFHSAYYR